MPNSTLEEPVSTSAPVSASSYQPTFYALRWSYCYGWGEEGSWAGWGRGYDQAAILNSIVSPPPLAEPVGEWRGDAMLVA